MKLNKEFFEKQGFDVSKEPYTKSCYLGVIYVYKNYIRDGSGKYEGYSITKPKTEYVLEEKEYFRAVTNHNNLVKTLTEIAELPSERQDECVVMAKRALHIL